MPPPCGGMEIDMKKRYIMIAALAILLLVSVVGVSHAKYVEELLNARGEITNPQFYFDSDVLKTSPKSLLEEGAEIPEPLEVPGEEITFHLYNAESSNRVSNVDVSYTLTYYVEMDGVWTEYDSVTGQLSASNGMSSQEFTVSPIEGYESVIVEAVSTAPYSKILTAHFQFFPLPSTVDYEFDWDTGVIQMTVATNGTSGSFHIQWSEGLLPDNADPNGILTQGSAGPDSVEADLDAFTTYTLYFFVSEDFRAELDSILNEAVSNGTYDETVSMLLTQAIQYHWVE